MPAEHPVVALKSSPDGLAELVNHFRPVARPLHRRRHGLRLEVEEEEELHGAPPRSSPDTMARGSVKGQRSPIPILAREHRPLRPATLEVLAVRAGRIV